MKLTAYFTKEIGTRTFTRKRTASNALQMLALVNEMESRGHKLVVIYAGSEKVEL